MAAYTIKKFKETQTVADKPKKGRPRTVRTKKLIKTTKTKITCNKKISISKLAVEAGISRQSMQQLVKEDLE
jgi:hypothetical protein